MFTLVTILFNFVLEVITREVPKHQVRFINIYTQVNYARRQQSIFGWANKVVKENIYLFWNKTIWITQNFLLIYSYYA